MSKKKMKPPPPPPPPLHSDQVLAYMDCDNPISALEDLDWTAMTSDDREWFTEFFRLIRPVIDNFERENQSKEYPFEARCFDDPTTLPDRDIERRLARDLSKIPITRMNVGALAREAAIQERFEAELRNRLDGRLKTLAIQREERSKLELGHQGGSNGVKV